ncbi:LruC domain-containing protein [Flammeovirga sp. SubArs3]|uniref:LruC domain-containing protein n=1 Tax=Flammeovirga sp. SubArs3 TaxID=2995316 RepID=UPI00248AFAC5|nr:LruC domain-containing protein [Flammeovirga sp. SubArs3]
MTHFFKRHLPVALFIITTLIGCSQKENDPTDPQSGAQDGQTALTDYTVPDGFNYETTQEINLRITSENVSQPVVYSIYAIEDGDNLQLRGKALSDAEGRLEYSTNFSNHIEALYIMRSSNGRDHFEKIQLTTNNINVNFNEESERVRNNNSRVQDCNDLLYAVNSDGEQFTIDLENSYAQSTPIAIAGGSQANAIDRSRNIMYYDVRTGSNSANLYSTDLATGTANLIGQNNTGISVFDNSYARMEYDHATDYLIIGDANRILIMDASDNSIVHNPTVNGLVPGGGNPNGGGDIAIDNNGNMYMATGTVGLYSMTFNSDTTVATCTQITPGSFPYYITGIAFDRNNNMYATVNSSGNAVLLQMDPSDGSYTILDTLDHPVRDISGYRCTAQEADSDDDGVVDANDDYPNNPNKAFNNNYPTAGAWSSVAYEDLYPHRGDFDFNDLIIEYNFNLITNADNDVVEMDMEFKAKSVQAHLHSGFAVELPFHADSISSVAGSILTGGVVSLDSKGLESGIPAEKPVVIIFDKSSDVLSGTGPVKSSSTINVVVSLSSPVALSSLGDVPYNPFIFVNSERDREVHLPGKSYTSKFKTTFIQAGEDVGGFKTVENYPWAVHVPIRFDPPKENVDITNAYVNFSTFATTGGGSNRNWYTMQEGNRNTSNLHEQ